MNSYNDLPKTRSRDCVRTASEQTHARSRRGRLPNGSLFSPPGDHDERVRPVAPDVLKPIPWIRARQGTQGQEPRHEADFRLPLRCLDQNG